MAVRVKLNIQPLKGSRESLLTSALVNSGYEVDRPELLIPEGLAKELGLWPPGVMSVEYASTPIGFGRLYSLGEVVEVQVTTSDKKSEAVKAHVMVSEYEKEVLISDYLAGLLKLAIEDFKDGLWRFRNDPKIRKSEVPQFW